MLTSAIISALFATSALAAALPAVLLAEARGINLAGTIPNDATPITGGFSFEAGSDAAAWVHAQIALGPVSSAIGIGMFAATDCGDGRGAWFDNVQYDVRYTDVVPVDYFSVGTAGRAMLRGESLMLMQRGKGLDGLDTLCAMTAGFARPSSPVGCFNMPNINCFRLQRDGR